MTKSKLKIVVAISGTGRSLLNLISRQNSHHYQICGVISSNSQALGLKYVKDHSLPYVVFDFKKPDIAAEVFDWLAKINADLVVLAGFLKKFPINQNWRNKIINIHPALLPKYGGQGMYGLKVHEAVLANNEKESGATVHFVSDLYDDGPIILQLKVDIASCKNAEEIAQKVFLAECELLPQALDDLYHEIILQHS